MIGPCIANDLVPCGISEGDLIMKIVKLLLKACKSRGLKMNADKSIMMVSGREEEAHVGGINVELFSEFKNLRLNESGIDRTKCCRKLEMGREVTGATNLRLGFTRTLHKDLLLPTWK